MHLARLHRREWEKVRDYRRTWEDGGHLLNPHKPAKRWEEEGPYLIRGELPNGKTSSGVEFGFTTHHDRCTVTLDIGTRRCRIYHIWLDFDGELFGYSLSLPGRPRLTLEAGDNLLLFRSYRYGKMERERRIRALPDDLFPEERDGPLDFTGEDNWWFSRVEKQTELFPTSDLLQITRFLYRVHAYPEQHEVKRIVEPKSYWGVRKSRSS